MQRTTNRIPIRRLPTRLLAAKVAGVGVLALAVTHISLVVHLDRALSAAIHDLTAGWLTSAFLTVSDLASSGFLLVATVIVAVALIAARQWHGAAALSMSVLTTQALVSVVKPLIERPRPDTDAAMVESGGSSFPSAHSASAVALYLVLALIAASILDRRLRTAAYIAAGAVVALVGLSRIYLGAHYPTDVLAGWLTGAVVAIISWRLCARLPAPARAA